MVIRISKFTKKLGILYIFCIISILCYQITYNNTFAAAIILPGLIYAFVSAYKDNEIALWLFFLLAFDFYGLIPMFGIGGGTLHWYDFNSILAAIMFFKYIKGIKWYRYGIVYLMLFVYIGIACYQSKVIYSQSILTTLLNARALFVGIAFWPIGYILYKKIPKERFYFIFEKFTRLSMVAYGISWILVNLGLNVTFLQTFARWGTRVYINPTFIILYFYLNLYYLIYKQSNTKKNLIMCIISVLTIVVVAQGRSMILYMLIVAGIMLLLSKRFKNTLKYIVLAVIAAAVLLSIPPIRTVVVDSLLESETQGGSIAIRMMEREYYNEKLEGHELWGVGIPNSHNTNTVAYTGQYQETTNSYRFSLDDLGAYKLYYQFGVTAYLLYIALLAVVLVSSFRKRAYSPFTFSGMGFFLIMLLNLDLIAYITMRPFGFMIALIFVEISNITDKESLG